MTAVKYIVGLCFAMGSAWCDSITVCHLRILKDVHFSLINFYYGLIVSTLLMSYLIIEYSLNQSLFPEGMRLLQYDMTQWKLLIAMIVINAFSSSLGTLAY